ncbi:MAG TPA: nuclear transport factor 2 family protein [Panacibacter sp.]|nr:nuclear transport factor 2 family protein [Panacibacter sp.]HNP43497.1 nuclear transport factor 2 family protein [Panacibacter sp.]
MKKISLLAIGATFLFSCGERPAEQPAAASTAPIATQTQPAEFADAKYADIGKQGLAALSKGDVDLWMTAMADNVKYYFNGGDSIIGKAAVSDYWKKRRGEVIDTIFFTSDIWLPLKVNAPQQPVQAPGIWLLSWYQVHSSYKASGKSMVQWIHTDMHFDANDKIDQVIQYLDRSVINAAMQK